MSNKHSSPSSGWKWGLFTTRVPFLHTRVEWPELLQGLVVAAATGLALVPVLMGPFALSFEEAVTCIIIHSFLITSAPIIFGEPFAPGWVTPALPFALTFISMDTFETPTERFQAMIALSLDLSLILFVLGITGLGSKLMKWLPTALKAAIIMGAAIAALKRVFLDDAARFLMQQPISTTIAIAVCLILTFSIPFAKIKMRNSFWAKVAALGLLPGFLMAAIIGPLPFIKEITYDIQWGIMIPPFMDLWAKASPFAIGWPSLNMMLQALPLAFIGYLIMFGDLITGIEILKTAQEKRPDDPIDINPQRSHYSLAIRNALMAISAPFFPTQGPLWTGVHVIIVERWKQGKEEVQSLFSGISSYYVFGIPIFYLLLPLTTAMKPLMGIALSLTLVLTGFACAYVAMAFPKSTTEKGVVLLGGVALAIFEPWLGLVVAFSATALLLGLKSSSSTEQHS